MPCKPFVLNALSLSGLFSLSKATVIKKDGVEISRSFERYVLDAGKLDASDNLVDTDISSEPAEVQAICNAVWTTDVKAAWKAKCIEDKDHLPGS